MAAIGLSRLYLGMHWLSDVAAGFALGLAWITLLGTAYITLRCTGASAGMADRRRRCSHGHGGRGLPRSVPPA
ncbi:phosphatase PAP2 family protein [Cupriavidus basilensis]